MGDMHLQKKCKKCGKELGDFEVCTLSLYFPPSPSFNMPSGGAETYCKECYRDVTGETALDKTNEKKAEKKLPDKIKKLRNSHTGISPINDVALNSNATIIGIIQSDIEYNEFQKDEGIILKKSCDIEDDTGKIKLILWNEQGVVQKHKIYKIKGYIREYNGTKQITLGYRGKIEEIR